MLDVINNGGVMGICPCGVESFVGVGEFGNIPKKLAFRRTPVGPVGLP